MFLQEVSTSGKMTGMGIFIAIIAGISGIFSQ